MLSEPASRIVRASNWRRLLTTHDAVKLLFAMGFETANVHLGSVKAAVLQRDLAKRPSGWLNKATEEWLESTTHDWEDWRKPKTTEKAKPAAPSFKHDPKRR